MKLGDLVKLKAGYHFDEEENIPYYRAGVITAIEEYDTSGLWYEVRWGKEWHWHREGDLELVSESR